MIEYDYRYKHLQLIAGAHKMIIELSRDNMFNEISYSAKSNLLFLDNDETWGHAVGVGGNEEDAVKMCLAEIRDYLNYEFTPIMKELNIPKKITFIYKRRTIILYIEQLDNNFSILTKNGRKNIITDNIVEYIADNPKEFINDSVDNYSEQLFKMHNFSKPFDAMTKKYNNSETCNLK